MTHPIITAYVESTAYNGFSCFGYDVNETLRKTPWTDIDKGIQKVITDFDALFIAPSSSHIALYRATSTDTLTPFISNGRILYPAFMSASRSLGAALIFFNRMHSDKEKMLLKIIYPKGNPYIDAPNLNNEQEVILPRGCTFTVSDWNPSPDESINIDLMVPGILEMKLLT